ncbi:MAG: ATP-binding protein [Candidatus Methanoplasma sp.]|jgi:AAA+ ATPase superfamily predicted ATPase|nr:ATP-binding protein [Candidatus Methanoplasma sp.]
MAPGFIGRSFEMKALNREYSKKSSLVLITGRRGVGKTRLITEFIADKDALYFYASEHTEPMLLSRFSEAVSRYAGREGARFDGWKRAFSAFCDSREGKKVLVIDEFQNMFRSSRSFLSRLQGIWDGSLSSENVMLILCGSDVSGMDSVDKRHDSPMCGRFDKRIELRPLSFEEARRGRGYADAVEEYSVHGGVPGRMARFDRATLRENVEANVMDPGSILFDASVSLLRGEVREPAAYMSILGAMAGGRDRISSISSAAGIPATTVTPYLKRLADMRLVNREVPVTERLPEKSKTGSYEIIDAFSLFWLRFASPHLSELSLGDAGGAMARFDERFAEDHVQPAFESICRDLAGRMGERIGFAPERVGRYWNRDMEIGVVALNMEERKAFVAECAYHRDRPVGRRALDDLRRKAASVGELDGYDVRFGLFSVSGFDDSLSGDGSVVLVDKGEVLERGLAAPRPP